MKKPHGGAWKPPDAYSPNDKGSLKTLPPIFQAALSCQQKAACVAKQIAKLKPNPMERRRLADILPNLCRPKGSLKKQNRLMLSQTIFAE
ncbi:hypothetical protein [Kingella oralis]|uniref:hypothetical protein n=1 Tax=Kingella oralis TaxID=505 RepID=UPI002D81074D|nr:hypothetical protein [Kingella oralis]